MIQKGAPTAIVVDRSWSYLKMVRRFLGSTDAGTDTPIGQGDSHLVIANVLEDSDPRGLWIELNTKKEKRPDAPEYRMMIPWHCLLAIVVNPEADLDAEPKKRSIGFVSLGAEPGDITSQKPVGYRKAE